MAKVVVIILTLFILSGCTFTPEMRNLRDRFLASMTMGTLFGGEAARQTWNSSASSSSNIPTSSSQMTHVYDAYDGSIWGYIQDNKIYSFRDGSYKGYISGGYFYANGYRAQVRDSHIWDNYGNPLLRIGEPDVCYTRSSP